MNAERITLGQTLLTGGILGWVMLPQIGMMPGWFAPLYAIIVVLSACQAGGIVEPLSIVAKIMTGVAAAAVLIFTYGLDDIQALVFPGFLLLLALKPLESRHRHEHVQSLLLAYLVIAANLMHNPSPLMMAHAASSCLLTVLGLLVVANGAERTAWRPLLARGAWLVLSAVPLAIIFFTVMPRLSAPWIAVDLGLTQTISGVGDTIQPGSISSIASSRDVAFRAEFKGRIPTHENLYWRGPVMWDFDGSAWRSDNQSRRVRILTAGMPAERITEVKITLQPYAHRWLFALDAPIRRVPMGYLTSNHELRALKPPDEVIQYTTISAQGPINAGPLDPRERERALRLPRTGNEKTRQLATRLRAGSSDDREVVNKAIRLFATGGFTYTLSPPRVEADFVDKFLFDIKEGFCESYASAFAFLMRAAGVPTRLVAGYQGGEINPVSGHLTVRQSSAHAWAEVWIDDWGWVRVDPTAMVAPERMRSGWAESTGLWGNDSRVVKLKAYLEAMDHLWTRWSLNEASGTNSTLTSAWKGLSHSPLAWGVLAAGIMGGALTWGLRRYDRHRRLTPQAQAIHALARLEGKLGLRRETGQTPCQYLHQAAIRHPDAAATLHDVASLYATLVYAGLSKEDAKQAIVQLQSAIGRLIMHIYSLK